MFPRSSGSHRKLGYRFLLGSRDPQCGHSLRGNGIGKSVAAVDEGHSDEVCQPDWDAGAVILGLTGLEIDPHNLGGGDNSCKTGGDVKTWSSAVK